MPGRGCLCDQPQMKHLGTEFLMSIPGRQHVTCVVTVHCWRSEAHPVCLHWDFQRLVPGFLQTSCHMTFSFAHIVLCCFAAQRIHLLNPVSSLTEFTWLKFLWVYNSAYTYFLKYGRIHTKLITVVNCGERRKEGERKGLGLVEISQRELWLNLACCF